MASAWRKLDRWILLVVTGILATSTGVASVGTGEAQAITGHTAYVHIVEASSGDGGPRGPPVEYGLATLQETWLFGAYSRTRIIDEDGHRMVFAWNADDPDPRRDPTLMPTGQHAVVFDRNGNGWSIYEFTYRGLDAQDDRGFARWVEGELDAAPTYHTYGVRLGTVHEQTGDWKGEARYNWALSYRLEKLFPDGPSVPAFDPEQIRDAATDAFGDAPPSPEHVGSVSTSATIVNPGDQPEPRPAEYHIQFGLGMQPEIMDRYDPAGGGIDRFYR